jgi:hypothetical protein
MSVRTRHTESLRVPGHRQSTQGESGPKPRASCRRRWQAGQRVLHQSVSLRVRGGRGQEGEPSKWTGWARLLKGVTEANPGRQSLRQVPSAGNRAEVIGPYAAQKSL